MKIVFILLFNIIFIYVIVIVCKLNGVSEKYTFPRINVKLKTVIPKNIFITWYTKHLKGQISKNFNNVKTLNPEFSIYLYDDNDCSEFIKQNFETEVLHAYNTLIPGAYKADLWRLCALYIYGGIYIDIKMQPFNNFKFYNLLYDEHFCKDRLDKCIYNAIIVSKPKNPFLLHVIRYILRNVKNNFYGLDDLHPTGPRLLGHVHDNHKYNLNIDMCFKDYNNISWNGKRICTSSHLLYKLLDRKSSYGLLWQSKNIYNINKKLMNI